MRERKVKKRGNLRKSPWQAFKGRSFYKKSITLSTYLHFDLRRKDDDYGFEDWLIPKMSGTSHPSTQLLGSLSLPNPFVLAKNPHKY